MKILLVNQFFWPDSAATSQLLTDVAHGLADRGHEVTVLCAENGGYAANDHDHAPVANILRVKSLAFARGKLGRVLSYGSFFLTAALRGLMIPKQDVIVTLTTPPLISLIGSLVKQWRGSKHYIWEMDVYPDVATDLNYIPRGGWIDRLTGIIADASRRQANGIVALGPCMKQRLVGRGVEADKIQIAENWADGSLIDFQPAAVSERELTLLYSGNLGLAHEIETLMHGMQELDREGQHRFVFSGGGAKRDALEKWCKQHEIRQAEFSAYSSRAALGTKLANADIGLVTQQDRCLGSVVPSKLYGLLAAGRPVLFIGPRESTVALVIRQFRCGWQIDCGDTDGLVQLLRYLARNRQEVVKAGHNARRTFLDHYDRATGVSRICRIIGADLDSQNQKQQKHAPQAKEALATVCSGTATS
jgi:colanic acid biosynthesis glycosyl transferase WcaI